MTCCTTYRKIVSGEAEGLGAGLARGALGVLSVPYRFGSSFVEIMKAGQGGIDVGVPVISVGNMTVGGTGKTPVVAMLVAALIEQGRQPVVLSRGYCAEDDGQNDEARVLSRKFPDVIHLQGKDRLALAQRAATSMLGDVLVVDDGFQYQRLHRTLNVCCIDASNPFGYGKLLPRGLLREPLSALYRARPVLITRAELASDAEIAEIRRVVLEHNEYAKIVVSRMKFTGLTNADGTPAGGVESLRGTRVYLASGVGNPTAFSRGVRTLGARQVGHDERGDHHAWTQPDADALAAAAGVAAADSVVTTVKDAVKLERLDWPEDAPPLRAIEVEAEITEGADLWDTLVSGALSR